MVSMDAHEAKKAQFYSATIVLVGMLWMTIFASTALANPIPVFEAIILFAAPVSLIFFSVLWRRAYHRARRSWMYYVARRNLILAWYVGLFVLPAVHACAVHYLVRQG